MMAITTQNELIVQTKNTHAYITHIDKDFVIASTHDVYIYKNCVHLAFGFVCIIDVLVYRWCCDISGKVPPVKNNQG